MLPTTPLQARARDLLARNARAIWERFREAGADPAEAYALVVEDEDGRVEIRVEERSLLASALRELPEDVISKNRSDLKADIIDFGELSADQIMVMVTPAGGLGSFVVRFDREHVQIDGTA